MPRKRDNGRSKRMNVSEIIEQAKAKYPASVCYKGRLVEDDINELEKICDVHCSSVYMDGTGTYSIQYRKYDLFHYNCLE